MKSKLALSLAAALVAACAGPQTAVEPLPTAGYEAVQFESADLEVRLIGALGAGNEGTLVSDPGWLEFLIELRNRGQRSLTVANVKILTPEGRYIESAAAYDQITAPPDASAELAEQVAVRSAGIAAGQAIPYGGTIVGIITGAAADSAARTRADARREFSRRALKEVELAPGGRVKGSAFLPNVANPRALVLDWRTSARSGRVELALTASR